MNPIPPTTSLRGRRVKITSKGGSPIWASVLEDPLNGYLKVRTSGAAATYWASKSLVSEVEPPLQEPT